MHTSGLLLLVLVVLTIAPSVAFAAPGDLCYEKIDGDLCGMMTNPISAITMPFEGLMPGFGSLLLWGPIVFVIWLVSKNTMITSATGLIIAVSVVGLNPQALGAGLLLVALSIGIAIFQLFPRIKQPLT